VLPYTRDTRHTTHDTHDTRHTTHTTQRDTLKYTAIAQYMFSVAQQQQSKGAKKGGKAEEEGEAADTSAEAAQTGQERRTFLLHDAMSALARPHQVYVYFHKSVYRVRIPLLHPTPTPTPHPHPKQTSVINGISACAGSWTRFLISSRVGSPMGGGGWVGCF
jgi:hypothetical protein